MLCFREMRGVVLVLFLSSCLGKAPEPVKKSAPETIKDGISEVVSVPNRDRVRKEVPVLCYHHIREQTPGRSPDYTINPSLFKAHIKALADSGYHAVLPEQLYQYLENGKPLPDKPIIISFDDGHAAHYTIAAPVLEQYGFKGTFFIMGIVISKPNCLSNQQIRELSDNGHAIGAHSWDHPDLRKMQTSEQWDLQLTKTKKRLEAITGKQVRYLAYPNGAWNEKVVAAVKERGYTAAFQLGRQLSDSAPLFTIRRIMVSGSWKPQKMLALIKR